MVAKERIKKLIENIKNIIKKQKRITKKNPKGENKSIVYFKNLNILNKIDFDLKLICKDI